MPVQLMLVRLHLRQPRLVVRRNGTLYVGVTNDLARRVYEHKIAAIRGFASKYGVKTLVWYEPHDFIAEAIAEEQRLKRWRRISKLALIEAMNRTCNDVYETPNQ